jgi:hypothetical protein
VTQNSLVTKHTTYYRPQNQKIPQNVESQNSAKLTTHVPQSHHLQSPAQHFVGFFGFADDNK